jgi:U3 small nucleolar RNA-associated protein 10
VFQFQNCFHNLFICFRRVQTKEVNNNLDHSIEEFFIRLSPYVLLRPAQKALEWLIYRYQIHIFNTDAFITMALPYHETNVFVRVVQCLNLSKEGKNSRWLWLEPLQKPGVPLARQTLLRRLATDLSLFSFVCELIPKALAVFDVEDVAPLRPMFSFYAGSVVGALECAEDVTTKEIAGEFCDQADDELMIIRVTLRPALPPMLYACHTAILDF